MVLVSVAYFATSTGLVPAATVMPPWVTPPVIGGVLATKSIAGGVLGRCQSDPFYFDLSAVRQGSYDPRKRRSFGCLMKKESRTGYLVLFFYGNK